MNGSIEGRTDGWEARWTHGWPTRKMTKRLVGGVDGFSDSWIEG